MKKEKQKVIFIHGGETFKTYDKYIEWLKGQKFDLEKEKKRNKRWSRQLGNSIKDINFINPNMPNKYNSKYKEWKIWFSKILETIEDNGNNIFIGHSLGATFLLKYFSENFEKIGKNNFRKLLLVSAAVEKEAGGYDLDTFDVDLELIKEIDSERIFIYHSRDDSVVDFKDFETLSKILPNAKTRVFEDRGHFSGEEFPEIIEDIKKNK